jgi:thioredoxin 1
MSQWIVKNTERLVLGGVLFGVVGLLFGANLSRSPDEIVPGQPTNSATQMDEGVDMQTISEKQGEVYHANQDNFAELVLSSDVPVLVDFYADWCGPCRMMEPVLEELAQETIDAKIIKVNVDLSPELAIRYGVSSIPNLKVFRDGRVVDDHVGMASKALLKNLLGI